METIDAIYTFLTKKGWAHLDDPEEQISFLAAGEYNENYLITIQEIYSEARHVLRINHGSQLGIDRQIEYEFTVLRALRRSGVTPRPFYCDTDTGYPELGNGVLFMEYLPGRPLEYAKDWQHASSIFAAIHSQPVDPMLITQPNPVLDIAKESLGLLNKFPDHPLTKHKQRLLAYHDQVLDMADEAHALFADDPRVIVNTEVNSHNFIIDDEANTASLVDWEKAVISSRYQDIGHFLVPTTTLWKTDFRFDAAGKRAFIQDYLTKAELDTDLETALRCTEIMEQTILLRALSWCFMAHYEYTQQDRALSNQDTLETITRYLDDMECFLEPRT